ncbi:hypothetical protein [Streptomyces phaeochromogenes]|uniref:hypothetical protein n=1 Tax=Streptomyces phaeochromogenes TaxID=1923 RepID=UPI00371B3AB2
MTHPVGTGSTQSARGGLPNHFAAANPDRTPVAPRLPHPHRGSAYINPPLGAAITVAVAAMAFLYLVIKDNDRNHGRWQPAAIGLWMLPSENASVPAAWWAPARLGN